MIAAVLAVVSGCRMPYLVRHHDPLSPTEHLNLGVAYEKQGDYEAAIAQYEAAVKAAPTTTSWLYLGNGHAYAKAYAKAEKAYRQALKLDAGNHRALNNLAWVLWSAGRDLEEAEQLAVKAVALAPAEADYAQTLDAVRQSRASR